MRESPGVSSQALAVTIMTRPKFVRDERRLGHWAVRKGFVAVSLLMSARAGCGSRVMPDSIRDSSAVGFTEVVDVVPPIDYAMAPDRVMALVAADVNAIADVAPKASDSESADTVPLADRIPS